MDDDCDQAESVVVPDYAFTATVRPTARGWFFRPEDAYSLSRYHGWVSNHLAVPAAAFHLHRVSVFRTIAAHCSRYARHCHDAQVLVVGCIAFA